MRSKELNSDCEIGRGGGSNNLILFQKRAKRLSETSPSNLGTSVRAFDATFIISSFPRVHMLSGRVSTWFQGLGFRVEGSW